MVAVEEQEYDRKQRNLYTVLKMEVSVCQVGGYVGGEIDR